MKDSTETAGRSIWSKWPWIVGGMVIILIIAGAIILYIRHQKKVNSDSSNTVSQITPTASTLITPTPSSTTSSTPSGTPSPTTSPTPAVPVTLQSAITTFYTDFTARNAAGLSTMFTPDVTTSDQDLHERLFNTETAGTVPGGPTLFQTDTAGESTKSYTIQSIQQSGTSWVIETNEQRVNLTNTAVPPVVTVLTFVPGATSGSWLISSYTYVNGTGKYDAFIVQ